MDIKAGPEHYPAVCGVSPDIDSVRESVQWLLSGVVPFEFRTTAVKGLHTNEDFRQISPWIAGCPDYYIQNYVPSERVLHPDGFSSFTKEELLSFAEITSPLQVRLSFAESITNGSTGGYPYTSTKSPVFIRLFFCQHKMGKTEHRGHIFFIAEIVSRNA